ncbi:hypothetical protein LCGC14_3134420, partial [marine sediment metagenome]
PQVRQGVAVDVTHDQFDVAGAGVEGPHAEPEEHPGAGVRGGWIRRIGRGHLVEAEESYWTDQMKIPTRFFPVGIEDSHYTPRPENEKIYDVSLIASIGNFYPLRLAISKEIEDLGKEHGWNVLLRRAPNDPDYRRDISKIHADAELRKEWLVGTDYAEALTRSKIFIFGSSIFRYPVAKYLEGLMSECLVMADRPFHAEDLHLKDGFNYVEITRDNWKEKLEYYLDDDQLRETIARHGRETAIKYHTNKVRAAEFIQMLRRSNIDQDHQDPHRRSHSDIRPPERRMDPPSI